MQTATPPRRLFFQQLTRLGGQTVLAGKKDYLFEGISYNFLCNDPTKKGVFICNTPLAIKDILLDHGSVFEVSGDVRNTFQHSRTPLLQRHNCTAERVFFIGKPEVLPPENVFYASCFIHCTAQTLENIPVARAAQPTLWVLDVPPPAPLPPLPAQHDVFIGAGIEPAQVFYGPGGGAGMRIAQFIETHAL